MSGVLTIDRRTGQYDARLDPKVHLEGELRECCGKPTFVSLFDWQSRDAEQVRRVVLCQVSNRQAIHCAGNPDRGPYPWETKAHVHRFVCKCGEVVR